MELALIFVIILTLFICFFCSLTEAALYSVPMPYVKHLAKSGSPAGKILLRFKEDMAVPIGGVLIFNTIANTAGPAIAGALVADLWGESAVVIFAAFMTLGILFIGETAPKIIGVTHAKKLSYIVALPISGVVFVLWPLIWFSRILSRTLNPNKQVPSFSHEEMLSMANVGTEEGTLDHFEGSVIANVIGLDKLFVRDVLTPRVVVFRISEDTPLADIQKQIQDWTFTRIPLYTEEDPDHLTSYVIQRDVYREILKGNLELTLKQLSRPLPVIPELMRADKLLLRMFEKKEHICAVVDEHGGFAGIITLEDIIEEIVGREIVDEYDTVSDLRTFASLLKVAKGRKKRGMESG